MLFGRVKPPAGLRKRLDGGERLLAIADGGSVALAASQWGLWLPQRGDWLSERGDWLSERGDWLSEQGDWRRVGWDDIVKAAWDEAGLEVIEGRDEDGIVSDLPPLRYRLSEPRNLPAVVRQRVEHSIARWEQVPVPGGSGRVVARRRPGQDGLRWTARLDAGTPDSAPAREALAGYLARVRQLPAAEQIGS